MTSPHHAAPTARDGWFFLAASLVLSSLIWSGLFFVDPADNPWAGGSGMSPSLLVLFLLGGSVPSLIGIAITFWRGGLGGLASLFGRLKPARRDLMLVPLALVLPVLAAIFARYLGELLGATAPVLDLSAIPRAAIMALAAALMEEFGWRGTAVPALRQRHSLLFTGLVVGLCWSVWHTVGGIWSVAPFFGDWFYAYYATGIVATMIGAGLSAASIWSLSNGRLFAVIAFHVAFSSSANVFTPSAGTPEGAVLIATVFAVVHLIIGGLLYGYAISSTTRA